MARNPIFVAYEQWRDKNPGKTLADYRKETGYDGPALKVRNRRGGKTQVSFKGEGSYKSERARKEALNKQDQIYIDTMIKNGLSESEAKARLKQAKANNKKLEKQVQELNKEHGPYSFSVGHETAAKEGGGDFDRNRRLEIGKGAGGNFSRSNNNELPDSVKPLMGIPRSGRGGKDSALLDLLRDQIANIMNTGLTPQDKQKIRRNPSSANDVMQRRQDIIDQNPLLQHKTRAVKSLIFGSPTVNESHPMGGNVIDTDPLGGMGLLMRTP